MGWKCIYHEENTEDLVAESRDQISRVANNTSVQHNNSTLSDVSQVQPGQSSNNAVSELAHLTRV